MTGLAYGWGAYGWGFLGGAAPPEPVIAKGYTAAMPGPADSTAASSARARSTARTHGPKFGVESEAS